MRCDLVRGRNHSRYEQFNISPETIEQNLRLVDTLVCEQQQTHTDLRRIIVYSRYPLLSRDRHFQSVTEFFRVVKITGTPHQ